MNLACDKAAKFITKGNEAVFFKLVRSTKDLEDDGSSFHPEFCHQFFGEQENIFGYSGLRINMYFSACDAQIYLAHSYQEKVDPKKFDGLEADDVMGLISKELPAGFFTNIDNFVEQLSKEHLFKPFGNLLHCYTIEKDGQKREFQIYKVDSYDKNFVSFYQRIETFALWFIDAASYIDTDDPKWQYYVVYEKFLNESLRTCFAIVGYSCVYHYYGYPENVKPRIGHFLILPPYQNCGNGVHLLQTIYNDLVPNPKVLEICVEDPAENFSRLRDYVDCMNCLKLAVFKPEVLKNGFTKDIAKEAQERLKIGKRQARRVFEILRLKFTNASNADEYREYRLSVKKRLYAPYKKSSKDWKNLQKAISPEEVGVLTATSQPEQMHQLLQTLFDETVDEYRRILNRLSTVHSFPDINLAIRNSTCTNGKDASNGTSNGHTNNIN